MARFRVLVRIGIVLWLGLRFGPHLLIIIWLVLE
jgi:hypothetical protein